MRLGWKSTAGGVALMVLLTVAVDWPALHGEFIFDDGPLIANNQLIQARDGLSRFWLTTEAPDYYPLTWSFWWLEWHLWGKNPAGYHAVNILLHAANVLLLWLVLSRLRIPGAWLAALLFAVHPVNVATVAWISEQKNIFSMLFFALSMLWYLRFEEERHGFWYGLSLAAFLLALLCKSAVVMLPVVLLGCVWWRQGRLRSVDLWRTAPFFALSLSLGLTTVWFQYHRVLNGQAVQIGGLFFRLMVAGAAPWFYLWKAVLPLNLCLIYPLWKPDTWGWSGYLPGLALVGIFAVFWRQRNHWGRPWLFGWGYFVVMLFPVLGFFDQGFYQHSLVADHWQYYSLAGITAMAAAGAATLTRRLDRSQRLVTGLVGGAVVIGLCALSWQRCSVFHNEETLFTDNLRRNPQAWGAHISLGNALQKEGRVQEAIGHFEQVLQIRPDYAQAHNNLGVALAEAGRTQAAMAHFEQALRIKPDLAEVHDNWGSTLTRMGRPQQAMEHFEQALRLRPDYAEAENGLGYALLQMGRIQEAIEHCQQAIRLRPEYAEACFNLGCALARAGETPAAIEQFEQALRIRPDFPEARAALQLAQNMKR